MLFIFFINVYSAFDKDEHHLIKYDENFLNTDSDCRISETFSTFLISNTQICLIKCQFNNIGSKTSQQSALSIGNSNDPSITNTIESCIFQNCMAQNGGAILIYGQPKGITNIINCDFLNNECSNYGGAIYISRANANFSNCTFTKNRASLESQTDINNCYGGSIFLEFSAGFFTNCTFKNNEIFYGNSLRSFGGSIFISESNQTFINCLFFECSIRTNVDSNHPSGGSLMCESSTCEFENCHFSNNFVESHGSNSESDGGSISIREAKGYLKNCIFNNNSIFSNSGDMFGGCFYISDSETEMINVLFNFNSIFSSYISSHSQGGAIHVQNTSHIMISECNFSNNFINSHQNSSVINGGAFHVIFSILELNNCFFVNNSSLYANKTHGGALYISSSESLIISSSFVNNFIVSILDSSENAGAAVITFESSTSFNNCSFINNSIDASTDSSFGYGGAVYVEESSRFQFCSFVENYIVSSFQSVGAAILCDSENIEFLKCKFERNVAETTRFASSSSSYCNGGAVNLAEDTVCVIRDCDFIENEVKSFYGQCYGGAIASYSKSCDLFNCVFLNNKIEAISASLVNGGAVTFSAVTNGICDNCTFHGNFVSNQGEAYSGAVFVPSERNFTFCEFTNNKVNSSHSDYQGAGGAVSIFSSPKAIFFHCLFQSNSMQSISASLGICIYSESSTLLFEFCDFVKNSGTVINGNIYGVFLLTGSTCQINQCNFKLNQITGLKSSSICQGCSIYSSNCNVYIELTKFESNSAVSTSEAQQCNSGGICLMGCFGIIKFCVFKSNSAETNSPSPAAGGSIYSYLTTCLVESSNFTGNFINVFYQDTGSYGGAIALRYSQFDFKDCNFFDNNIRTSFASSNAGAIMMYFSNATFSDCVFMNNNATLAAGGALVILNGIGIFEKCSFVNNNANTGDDIFIQFTSIDFCLEIRNCTFKKDYVLSGNSKCMFYFSYGASSSYLNLFVNNFVTILGQPQMVIFGGFSYNSAQNFWIFRNNCIHPYESDLFISNQFALIDASNFNFVTFDTAFDRFCVYHSSSFTFISHFFTNSHAFTKSQPFSSSFHFTKSFLFSESMHFSTSNIFTLSKQFSKSRVFSKSDIFSVSDFFSKSQSFSPYQSPTSSVTQSSSPSQSLSQSKTFTKSRTFTKSSIFSMSKKFTKSDVFSTSKEFSKSASFSSTNRFTKSDLFSKSQCFSKSEVFTKSNEISKIVGLDSGIETEITSLLIISDLETYSSSFVDSYSDLNSDPINLSETETNSIFSYENFNSKSFFSYSKFYTNEISFGLNYSNIFQISSTFNSQISDVILLPNTESPGKKGSGKAMIIGIVCGIVALILISSIVVFLVIKKRLKKKENSLNEDQKSFVETRSNKGQSDNTLNVDEEDRDLGFWL